MFIANTAYRFAQASEAAYPNGKPLEEKLKAIGYSLVKTLGDLENGIGGYVCIDNLKNYTLVVMKGTHNWETLKHDINCFQQEINGVDFARGFYDAYEHIKKDLVETLKSCPAPFYITGHSLGGAMAAIASLKLGCFARCYTFGAPRIGDKTIELLDDDKTIIRVVNNFDPVPLLPLFYWPFVGKLYLLLGSKLICGWTAYPLRFFTMFGWINHHKIETYIEKLRKLNR